MIQFDDTKNLYILVRKALAKYSGFPFYEDMVQDCVIRVYRSSKTYDPILSNWTTYVYMIANKNAQIYYKKYTRQESDYNYDGNDNSFVDNLYFANDDNVYEQLNWIESLDLPVKLKEYLKIKTIDPNLTNIEIGKMLNLKEKAMEAYFSRHRKKLGELYETSR